MAGLAWMVVANAASLLGTHALWRRCRTGSMAADAALFLALRFTLTSSAVLLAGLAGGLRSSVLGLAGAAVLGILLFLGEHRQIRLPDGRLLRDRVGRMMLAVALLFLARLLVQVWFVTPHAGDAITYHLPKVAEWIQAGRITAETGIAWRSAFPGGFELFEMWWCLFLHHDLLIECAGVEMWLMGFAAVVALARWTGMAHQGAFLAGLLFAATPIMLMQAVACLNDVTVVALFLTATALVAVRAHPLLVLVPLGAGLGVKPTIGFALPGLLVLAFLVRRDPAVPVRGRSTALACALMAGALGSYWYLRNWAIYGNPIHPGTSQGFFEGHLVQQVGPNLTSLKENLRRIIDSRLYDSLAGYNAQCNFATNWGPCVFAAGLPGLMIALREGGRFSRVALALGVSMVTVLVMVLSDPWFTRFVLFVPAVLCIAAARLAVAQRGVSLLVAIALGYQFVGTLVTDRLIPIGEQTRMVSQSWRERSSEMLGSGFPREETALATWGTGNFDYLLYDPDFSRQVRPIRKESVDELLAEMRRLGLRVVYASGQRATELLTQSLIEKRVKALGGNFYALPEWPGRVTSPSDKP
jgi:hypothetical protein